MEIVITGRGATDELMKLCDLVTEMNCVKHCFDAGISARKGIDSDPSINSGTALRWASS